MPPISPPPSLFCFGQTDPEARFVRVCRSEVRIKSISAHVLREGELLPAQPAPQDLVRGFLALAVSDTNINSNFVYFNDPRFVCSERKAGIAIDVVC